MGFGTILPIAYVMVDVEADGPIPGDDAMVCFGAVVVEPALNRTFYRRWKPISNRWVPEAATPSGFSRDDVSEFDALADMMSRLDDWLRESSTPSTK